MGQTVAEIKKMLESVDEQSFADMQRSLAADTRVGVLRALKSAAARLEAARAEKERVAGMYAFEQELAADLVGSNTGDDWHAVEQGLAWDLVSVDAGSKKREVERGLAWESSRAGGCDTPDTKLSTAPVMLDLARAGGCERQYVVLGLDEVGRGPLAGPLAIGAVILGGDKRIDGLNDSKKLSAHAREEIAKVVRERAVFCDVVFISPREIDSRGISAALGQAFSCGISRAQEKCPDIDAILLDGNPMHLHEREISVVKGDAKCASIAAASIVAKVGRDALMRKLSREYPEYKWDENKGYGSAAHIEAIKKYGLSPYHRKSFCVNFTQEALF